jgi:hypothetical protein
MPPTPPRLPQPPQKRKKLADKIIRKLFPVLKTFFATTSLWNYSKYKKKICLDKTNGLEMLCCGKVILQPPPANKQFLTAKSTGQP